MPRRKQILSQEEIANKRQLRSDTQRERRAQQDEQQLQQSQLESRDRQRIRRSEMDESQIQQNRDASRDLQSQRRLQFNIEQLEQERNANKQRQRVRRSQMDRDQLQQEQNVNRERQRIQEEINQEIPGQLDIENDLLELGDGFQQLEDNVPNPVTRRQKRQQTNEQRQELRPIQRLNNNRRSRNTALLPENFEESLIVEHNLGLMNCVCPHCNAKFFKGESMNICCSGGTIVLDKIKMHPDIKSYMDGSNRNSKNFRDNIRQYNSAMAFASMGAKVDETITNNRGPFCYRIHGQVYHRTGGLHPDIGQSAKYAQLYILDSSEALNARIENPANNKCLRDVMENLQNILGEINPFSALYKHMRQFEQEEILRANLEGRPSLDVVMTFLGNESLHKGRINAPTVTKGEIAAIFHNPDGEPPSNRDIVIHSKNGILQNISILNKNCDPMCYPLLFPYGDSGWTLNLKKVAKPQPTENEDIEEDIEDLSESTKNMTMLQWYAYHFQIRQVFNPFLNSGKLTHQFMVDAYCKIEANNLSFIRLNQVQLRAEDYDVLNNYVNSRGAADKNISLGRKVILPSSFPGSPRNMFQNYHDAMAMVRKFGKPDLFITFTCNPKWNEITQNLLQGEQASDRPDLVARVFNLKLQALKEELKTKHILGRVVAMLHVIEFQKRGLPHAHMLLILVQEDKVWEKEKVDKIVCAELPNKEIHPRLASIVSSCMIHGPCGALNPKAPCMENNKCTKSFPKDYCQETNTNVNGYPMYERKDDGRFIELGGNIVDNRWVVPYNPYLSLKYNAHINVEICSSIQSVKYLFKYVYKGHDCANVQLKTVPNEEGYTLEWDEVKWYLDARYVSAPESIWRAFKFLMHQQTHTIIKLNVHLENKQSIFFLPGEEQKAIEERWQKSKLLAWFRLNQRTVNARQYLYIEIPEYYTWDKKNAKWNARKRGKFTTIGRMYSVSPTDREKYFLRLLLLHVRGATSFEDMRKVDGNPIPYNTYQDACIARGLLDDDSEWDTCLNEAALIQMPFQLRQLFAFICITCEPSDPRALFEKHKDFLIEDYKRTHQIGDQALYLALRDIESVLASSGKRLTDFHLPNIPSDAFNDMFICDIYDATQEKLKFEEKYGLLNPEQKFVFDSIVDSIISHNNSQRSFFIDGPGGSGKTFIYNTLMHYIRSRNKTVLPCAHTGIAATLLEGGRTSHSLFKLPIPLDETSVSGIKSYSNEADVLRKAEIIIWDEASMAPSLGINVVDTLLRQILTEEAKPLRSENIPFGNKVFVFGGDFCQTLPIVPHGNRTTILAACIKNSKCWNKLQKFKLKKNMRANVEQDETNSQTSLPDFAQWLIKLGMGELQEPDMAEGIFEIPSICVVKDSIVDAIFPKVVSPEEVHLIEDRAILTPRNEDQLKISEDILLRIQSETRTYLSVDSIQDSNADDNEYYPVEFLNTLTPGNMPPHRLNLKIGAVVMLLRNLDASRALCNGTRLVVKQMMSRVLDCEVLTGSSKGKRVFIPRIILAPSDSDLPFTLRRRQFPIRLSYAITINKSQGQTLDKVGIYLPAPVFGHGQLYVAFSRTKSFNQVKVKIIPTDEQGELKKDGRMFTKNVVYKEIFSS